MNELIKMVEDRVGLPEDKAKAATDTVLNYVKSKLPGPVASQIDSVVSGGEGNAIKDAAGKVGSMFGK